MVIDTSAPLAVLLGEPERDGLIAAIVAAPTRSMSAANYLETAIIVDDRLGHDGDRDLRLFIAEAEIDIVAVTLAQAEAARDANRRFGKENHPARLNFGDCFAYALAKHMGEPLLYKGDDSARTDLEAA